MPATTRLDPDGDLTLVIGQNSKKRDFVVCSRTLSRASLVFKRMLNGNFLEARPTDGSPWVVNLPEDHPGVAKILLAIIHSRFDLAPALGERPPTKELYEVLVFTDKYDLTRLLRPWAQSWIPSADTFSKSTDYNRLLGIAWELGAESALEILARRMVSGFGIDLTNGQLLGYDGLPISDDPTMALVPHGWFGKLCRFIPD